MITNNFNTNINFLNSRDIDKKILYIGTEVLVNELWSLTLILSVYFPLFYVSTVLLLREPPMAYVLV